MNIAIHKNTKIYASFQGNHPHRLYIICPYDRSLCCVILRKGRIYT